MNLIDPLWSTTDGQNATPNVVSPSNNDSSPFTQNQTASIVTAIMDSGTHLWSFKSYWCITIPLTITTIFLPLIAGAIFRAASRFLYRNRTYWRLSGITLVLALDVEFYILTDVSEKPIPNFGVICLGIPAICLLGRAIWRKQDRGIWSVYLGLVTLASVPFPPLCSRILFTLVFIYSAAAFYRYELRSDFRPILQRVRLNWWKRPQGRIGGDAERGETDGGMRRDSGDS
jgi:hypothetical protein